MYMTYTLSEYLNVHLMASREELTKCLWIALNKSGKKLNNLVIKYKPTKCTFSKLIF